MHQAISEIEKHIHKTTYQVMFIILALIFSHAAFAISNQNVVVADLTAGVTTTYTISFQTDRALSSGDIMAIATGSGGPDFSGASIGTISISGTQSTTTTTQVNTNITGAVTAGTTVTYTLTGVVNPGTAGQGPNYTFTTVAFTPGPDVIQVNLAGSIYTASNLPVVISPIADLDRFEGDGAVVHISDLDTVFDDADGDNLTFAVVPGNDVNVATAAINGSDALTITPTGSGTTNVTISATSVDGMTSDTFEVSIIGELDNAFVIPQNLDAGATTTYDVSFNPASTIVSGQIIFILTGAGGPDYTNAGITLSGGSLTGIIFSQSTGGILVQTTGGTATSSDTVQLTITNVVNPGASGAGPDYLIRLTDFGLNDIDRVTVAGSIYGAVGIPTVTSPIANQALNEANGATVVVADLNNVFTDGNGDTMTFSIEAGNDTNVATASVSGNELTVTGTGPGITTVTVKASDLPGGEGEVTDSFDVSVIGLMDNASFTPTSFDTEVTTSYTFSFTPSSTLGPDQFIIISNAAANGPDYTAATLEPITGGTLTASISSQSDTSIAIEIMTGSATNGDTVSFVLNDVVNPTNGGTGPDYQLRLFRILPAPSGDVEQNILAGSLYIDVGIPAVTAPITDQTLNQIDGASVIVNDLNSVFTDGNGQNLVFTVEPGNDTNIATASIVGDELTVTPVGSGTTTINIQASDLAAGGTGTAVDSFQLRVVGQLTNASVTPMSFEVNTATPYDVSFKPAGPINTGHVIMITTSAGGPDFTLASLENFTGGSLSAELLAQSPLALTIGINAGNATSADTVSYRLNPVTNPQNEGSAPAYQIDVIDVSTVLDTVTIPGNTYVDTDTIFINGFETIVLDADLIAKVNVSLIPYLEDQLYSHPFYDSESGYYLFLGESLSKDDDNHQQRNAVVVIQWLEQTLINHRPNGDWDQDGILNHTDDNPFEIN